MIQCLQTMTLESDVVERHDQIADRVLAVIQPLLERGEVPTLVIGNSNGVVFVSSLRPNPTTEKLESVVRQR